VAPPGWRGAARHRNLPGMAVATEQRARRAARITTRIAAWTQRLSAWAQRWARVLSTAAGTAAVAGAGQLGIAYGMGMVHLPTGIPAAGMWETQLTWVAWFAALAVLAGAAGGAWMARRQAARARPGAPGPLELGQRIVVSLAAAVGAGIVIFLTALPARTIDLSGSDPALEAALAALLGVVVGILAAVTTMSLRVAAVSVVTIVTVVWVIALASVAPTLGPDAQPALVRPGVLDLPAFGDGARSTVARLSAPLLVLLISTALAAAARSRGMPRLHTIAAGVAGPALLALAYLIAPPAGDDRAVQGPAFGGAMIALGIALLAAVMLAMTRLPTSQVGDPPSGDDDTRAWGAAPTGVSATAAVGATVPEFPPRTTDYAPRTTDYAPREADFPPPADPAPPEPEPIQPPAAPPPRAEPAGTARAESTWFDPAGSDPAGSDPAGSEPAGSEPVAAEPARHSGPEPAAEPERTATHRKRRRRKEEPEQDQHMDWVRSLGGESERDDPALGKRRLRRDLDLPD
jgi:hypothetical protein